MGSYILKLFKAAIKVFWKQTFLSTIQEILIITVKMLPVCVTLLTPP
jgi:hypothetical protein